MDYRAEIVVPASPPAAYRAITEGMSDWWTPMDSRFLKLGDRAKTYFGGESYWVLEAVTLNEPSLVELRCCEAYHVHDGLPDGIKEEWLGTVLRFEIAGTGSGTSITLTHEGLHEGLLCYEVCEAGWNHFFLESLKSHLESE